MPQVCCRLVETRTTACMPRCARPELLHGENRFTGNSGTVKISLKLGGCRNFTIRIVSTFLNNVLYLARPKKLAQYVGE